MNIVQLRRLAEPLLVPCLGCDAGFPPLCTCPAGDMRLVIQELLKALDEVQPLTGWMETTTVDSAVRTFVRSEP